MSSADHQVRKLEQLESLHTLHDRLGQYDAAYALRQRARAYAERRGLALPDWAKPRKRGGEEHRPRKAQLPAPAPQPVLTATVAEQAPQPIQLPRYLSVRAWAQARPGDRALIWYGADPAVALVTWSGGERRECKFSSEAAALEAITAGAISWAACKPRGLKPAKAAWGNRPKVA